MKEGTKGFSVLAAIMLVVAIILLLQKYHSHNAPNKAVCLYADSVSESIEKDRREIEKGRKDSIRAETFLLHYNVISPRHCFCQNIDFDPFSNSEKWLFNLDLSEGQYFHFHKSIRVWSDATFRKSIRLRSCRFLQAVSLTATFANGINFNRSCFQGRVSFYRSRFNIEADFNLSKFYKEVSFWNSTFYTDAHFRNTHFVEDADFEDAIFKSSVYFDYAHFNANADFKDVEFQKEVSFRKIKTSDSTFFDFEGSELPDTIDFSFNGKIGKEIDLSNAWFSSSKRYNKELGAYFRPHYISLYKTDISKFHFDYIHFRLITDSIELDNGERIKIPMDEADGMYEALLENFKSRGQMESYKLLDIEYKKYKYLNSSNPWMVIFTQYWWNFGYNKEWIFMWTALLLLLFTLVTFFNLKYLKSVCLVTNIGDIPSLREKRFTLKESYKRMWQAFVYTAVIFFRLTLKIDTINYRKIWGTFYIFLMYLVGIVCMAYMANYIIQE